MLNPIYFSTYVPLPPPLPLPLLFFHQSHQKVYLANLKDVYCSRSKYNQTNLCSHQCLAMYCCNLLSL